MAEELKQKKAHTSNMEKYFETHQAVIETYIDQLKLKFIDSPDIETRLPAQFL